MVKQIPISRGFYALVDDADYDAVIAAGPWHVNPGGRTVYAQRNTVNDGRKTTQSMHRFLVDAETVDHVDGDGLNNQRSNLRAASRAGNAHNRKVRRDSTSGFKGVHRNGPSGLPWRAQICVAGKKKHLGLYATPAAAAAAYDEAARKHYGEFARLNFPDEGEQAA